MSRPSLTIEVEVEGAPRLWISAMHLSEEARVVADLRTRRDSLARDIAEEIDRCIERFDERACRYRFGPPDYMSEAA